MRPLPALLIALSSLISTAAPSFADMGPPPPKYEVERGQLILPSHLVFAFKAKTDELEPKSLRATARVAEFLTEKEAITTMRVEAHVGIEEAGTAAEAQALSEKRALAVAKALVERGIACERLLPVGFGVTKPVAPAKSPTNTRVETHMAGMRGRAIGGMPMDGGGQVAGDPCAK